MIEIGGTCKDCAHFDHYDEDKAHGACDVADKVEPYSEPREHMWAIDPFVGIGVGPDFGCIHWTARLVEEKR